MADHQTQTQPASNDGEEDVVQQLQYKGQAALLDAIDKLSYIGLDHHISFPRIIVCGDQSAGKSSVLEAISHVRFPTGDSLCTTFATELVIRRTLGPGPPVSIIPGPSRDEATKTRLQAWTGEYNGPDDLPNLIQAARLAMTSPEASASSCFDDTLRIQVCKPNWPPLTIMDLPGLIHSANLGQPQTDVQLVLNLVKHHMKDPRSIILAVVSANNDAATQAVLRLVKEVDLDGSRTLGVITKPDLLPPAGSDSVKNVVKLVLNEPGNNYHFLHWHVLKNRSYETQDQDASQRDAAERRFFAQEPWANHVNPSSLGVDALRKRLSNVLHEHIVSSLPEVIEEINTARRDTDEKLAKLGQGRSSRSDKQSYLTDVAQRFQALAQSATEGTWNNYRFFESQYDRRLRAVAQNLNDDFAELMDRKGHRWLLSEDCEDPDPSFAKNRYSNSFPEPPIISRRDFENKVEELAYKSRGQELPGVFNHHMIGELFRQQSKNWKDIATHHVTAVWSAVNHFVEQVLESLVDGKTYNALVFEFIEPRMEDRQKKALAKLDEVLTPYTRSHPISYNRNLLRWMKEATTERKKERIRKHFQESGLNKTEALAHLTSGALETQLLTTLDPTQQDLEDKFACSDVLDYMHAYYSVAMNTFIDNVSTLVVENCLVDGLINLFPADQVPYMTDEVLNRLASESEEDQLMRTKLQKKQACLNEGLIICGDQAKNVTRDKWARNNNSSAPLIEFTPPSSSQNSNSVPAGSNTPGPARPAARTPSGPSHTATGSLFSGLTDKSPAGSPSSQPSQSGSLFSKGKAPATAPPVFGSASGLGSSKPASSSSTATTTPTFGLFGSPTSRPGTSSAGVTKDSRPGQSGTENGSSPFSKNLFGGAASVGNIGTKGTSTSLSTLLKPHFLEDQSSNSTTRDHYQSMTVDPHLANYSFEEHRLEDYNNGYTYPRRAS